MAANVCPVTPGFVAEVGDVDSSQPIEASDLLAIKEAFAKYAVLIFPDQHLSADQHLDFARRFGPLETSIAVYRGEARLRLRKEFADVSNLDHNNELCGKEKQAGFVPAVQPARHTESLFKRLPALASLLYPASPVRSLDSSTSMLRGFYQLNPLVNRVLPVEFSGGLLNCAALVDIGGWILLEVPQRGGREGLELFGLDGRDDTGALISLEREMPHRSADYEPTRRCRLHDRQLGGAGCDGERACLWTGDELTQFQARSTAAFCKFSTSRLNTGPLLWKSSF
jgi:Taurine catabolism dioxygenase TauD, TfdA family